MMIVKGDAADVNVPPTDGNDMDDGDNQVSTLQKSGNFFIEVAKVVIIALIIILPVRYFLIQPFYVRGASMEPNFHDYEYLIIDELSYRFHEPRRGDVVVLRDPRDTSQYFVKRLIGLPNEEVRIQGGAIRIMNDAAPDGFVLDESVYLDPTVTTSGSVTVKLGSDEYFILGDNRAASLDSRSLGPIQRDDLIGRVWIRAWPLRRMAHITTPVYP